jgi:hypothetical protein
MLTRELANEANWQAEGVFVAISALEGVLLRLSMDGLSAVDQRSQTNNV